MRSGHLTRLLRISSETFKIETSTNPIPHIALRTVDYDKIIKLILQKSSGEIAPEELSSLEEWTAGNPDRAKLVAELTDPNVLEEYRMLRSRVSSEKAYEEMCRRLELESKVSTRRTMTWISAAAAVAVAVWAGISYLTPNSLEKPAEPLALTSVEQLHPGAAKATLTLSDGSQLELNGEKTEFPEIAATEHKSAKEVNLSLEVPRGGEFMIVLEDSTKVWLNSASKLTYPEHFAEGRRHVSIEGEAYFEVARDSSRPFYVEVPGAQIVKVYGTEFNVRSYPEDPEVRTTLCEGSISLTQANGNGGELFLSPGNQAVFDKTTCVANLRTADIERVSGWRNGRFVFEEQTLNQIMQDLSRWYDFEFEFKDNDLRETVFMGSIPRYSNFTTAIAILEKSGGIAFDIVNNKVVITKKPNHK